MFNLKKYLKITKQIIKMSLMVLMQYKINFFILSLTTIVYAVVQLVFLKYLLASSSVENLGGFNKDQLYFVFFCGQLVIVIFFGLIHSNFKKVYDQIHTGELDFLLIKPAKTSFMILFQKVDFSTISILIYSIMGLIYLWGDVSLTFIQGLNILFSLIIGTILLYSLCLLAISLAFFYDQFFGLYKLISGLIDFHRYPVNIYPFYLAFFLSFIIPIFMVVNPIFNILDNSFGWIKAGEMLAITIIFNILAWTVWSKGLKRYASAG